MKLSLQQVPAVVLAGGFGTRVRHLLPDLPKPMAPIAGRPFVEWVVRFLVKQGLRRVVIAAGYLADVVEHHFQSFSLSDVCVRCVVEPQPLGTAGAFLHAARSVAWDPPAWLVLNGDSLIFDDLSRLADELRTPGAQGAILGLAVPNAVRFGLMECDREGNLVRFSEKAPGSGIMSAGVYLLRRELLGAFPEGSLQSFERDVFPWWAERGARVKVVVAKAPFLDIGTEESLGQAEAFIRGHGAQFCI